MMLYVVIALVMVNYSAGAPPLRLTIDCSDERVTPYGSSFRSKDYGRRPSVAVDSFCNLIHNAIPKAVRDGKFLLLEDDQAGFSDTQVPMSVAPPKGFIPSLTLPRLKTPKVRVPKLKVPKLKPHMESSRRAPVVGSAMPFSHISSMMPEEDSSAERMEKLKKGVKKMLHFVKVLGQIDQYLSERIRIVVDKVSKTFAE